jgi:DNA-binding transcriptional LysR family regulator
MELKWLEDLIALADAETLTKAAERRNVTQPAFSRRLKAIEDWLGTPVVDRSRKPACVTPAIRRQIDTIRTLAHNFRQLRNEIQAWESTQRRLVIAAQHTISVFYLPRFLKRLPDVLPATAIRLRSANRDECYSMLMIREAMILVCYETSRLPLAADETLLEKAQLGRDSLIPVARAGFQERWRASLAQPQTLPIISYPAEVFLGTILHHDILPPLEARYRVSATCETALVPAVVELALAGVGVAWLPRSAAAKHLADSRLEDLCPLLGEYPLDLIAVRIRTPRSQFADAVWTQLQFFAASVPDG